MTFKTTKNANYENVNDIDPITASELMNNASITWIDVRSSEEYTGELSHIKVSKLIPMDQIPNQLADINKNDTKIFICRSGARSAKTCQYLQGIGYTNCYNLAGGMIKWNELQLPTEGK
ncbi:MAG: rhodanese-like domain-containing protein [Bdellovibrionales bacterium]|nr:rhodanese-like domain-containing protein [Bdellovibrionales bacterium]